MDWNFTNAGIVFLFVILDILFANTASRNRDSCLTADENQSLVFNDLSRNSSIIEMRPLTEEVRRNLRSALISDSLGGEACV